MILKPVETIKLYQCKPSPLTFQPGEVVFSQGDTGKFIYGVVSGEVEMYLNNKFIETIREGDIFGEGALVHQDHLRTSTAIAKTKTVLAFLDRERFLFVTQQTPMFALEVMRSYSDRFRHLKSIFVKLLDDRNKEF